MATLVAMGCELSGEDPLERSSTSITGACSAPTSSGVTASGDDGNAPTNAVDGDVGTRWSAKGSGAWIRFDLGAVKTLHHVKIAWYKGDERKANLRIEVSSDGAVFDEVFSGASSGDTNDLEDYALAAPVSARFVRIVVDGNNQNSWASITEVRVCAGGASNAGPGCDAGAPLDAGASDAGAQPQADAAAEGPYPVPPAFKTVGAFNTDFEFWDRYTTNYASGGSGPSQRWDNEAMDMVAMVAGYEFKIGPDHGKRGDDEVSLKFPRCKTKSGDRGNYIPTIEWFEDGSNSIGGVGKEYPHPTTSHLAFNVDDPRPQIGNIKDGQWHGFLAAIYNDAAGAPTIELWYNPSASGLIQDYVFLGRSKDTGAGDTKMTPAPVLPFSGEGGSGGHDMQIRIDEIPRDSLAVRKMFAVEVLPPPGQ